MKTPSIAWLLCFKIIQCLLWQGVAMDHYEFYPKPSRFFKVYILLKSTWATGSWKCAVCWHRIQVTVNKMFERAVSPRRHHQRAQQELFFEPHSRVVHERATLKYFATERAGEKLRDTGGLRKIPPGAVTRKWLAKKANVSSWKPCVDSGCCHMLHREHLQNYEMLSWEQWEKPSLEGRWVINFQHPNMPPLKPTWGVAMWDFSLYSWQRSNYFPTKKKLEQTRFSRGNIGL